MCALAHGDAETYLCSGVWCVRAFGECLCVHDARTCVCTICMYSCMYVCVLTVSLSNNSTVVMLKHKNLFARNYRLTTENHLIIQF